MGLEPKNIMFSEDYQNIKLIDFGASSMLFTSSRHTSSAARGSSRYMSPEQAEQTLCFGIDIWAFGCILLQFATNVTPFQNSDSILNMDLSSVKDRMNPLEYAYRHFQDNCDLLTSNPDLSYLLRSCFEREHTKRPSAKELM